MDSRKYLEAFRDHLIRIMNTAFTPQEVDNLAKICNLKVIEPILNQLNATVEVPASFEPEKPISVNENQNSTQLQTRVAVQKQQTQRIQISEQQEVNQEVSSHEYLIAAAIQPLTPEQVASADFAMITNEFDESKIEQTNRNSRIWSLKDVISDRYGEKGPELSPNILMTSDFALVCKDKLDLFAKFRKDVYQVLLIRDFEEGAAGRVAKTKVMILSINDADAVTKALNIARVSGTNREMTLMRPNGMFISSSTLNNEPDPDLLKDPEVVRLLTQINYFRGSTEDLAKPLFFNDFKSWISSVDRDKYRSFFESVILPSRASFPVRALWPE